MGNLKCKFGIIYFIFLVAFSSCVTSQSLKEVKPDTSIKMLDFFFYLEKDNIFEFNQNGVSDNFYKVILLPDYEHGQEDFIGEALDHVFLLKGERGDYPLGKLYDLGMYYNVFSCEIKNDKLVISYFNKENLKIAVFKVP